MKPVRMISAAEQEMVDAAAYYEKQSTGLGADFYDMVEQSVAEIAGNPDAWSLVSGSTRKRSVSRFPFFILYRIETDAIVIQAVMHMHRNPKRWQNRI